MSVSLPEDVMDWLKLVAKLRGMTPDQLAADVIRIFRGIWMSGYEYGKEEQAIETPIPSVARAGLSIIVHERGDTVELRDGAQGVKIRDLNGVSLFIYGDEIEKITTKQVGGKNICITAPHGYENAICHIISPDELRVKSREFPRCGRISVKRPPEVRKIEICHGRKALYVVLLRL